MNRVLMVLVALALTGCADVVGLATGNATLHIESTAQWSGSIAYGDNTSETVAGNGNRKIELGGGTSCWTIQKRTEAGTLTAYAKRAGSTDGRASTSAAYGVISGCTGR
jgi:hypothetical protein